MIDPKLTQQIKAWLDTPTQQRDIAQGAMLLLKINRNQVLYANIIRKPELMAGKLEYELNRQMRFRLEQKTHEQVCQMEDRVARMAKRDFAPANNPASGFKAGKRDDHDSLPDEIKALYVENKSVLQRMRDLHAQLRVIQQAPPGYTCKDSDKYPFLKELIRLDTLYRDNWARYDGFDRQTAETVEAADARQENRRALAFINFNKRKYRDNPDEELGKRLAEAYARVTAPTDKLTAELQQLGIIK